ncbi:MAG: hypothetical protein KKD86_01275 [Bacteroidetes bacterium]|nr:hypothetical protein [Bacteroidota bacterium]MBU1677478.1 hypothetical protein [Bacteroidota bacterium]
MGNQQMLVIGGLLILSYLMLTFYNVRNDQTSFSLFTENVITGTSVGQSLIDEIQTKSFDEKTISSAVTSADSLTSVNSIGPDAGETNKSKFDDVDDYNGLKYSVSTNRIGTFSLSSQVYYVQNLNPNTKINQRSFAKRVDVFVTNPLFEDTLKFSTVISY